MKDADWAATLDQLRARRSTSSRRARPEPVEGRARRARDADTGVPFVPETPTLRLTDGTRKTTDLLRPLDTLMCPRERRAAWHYNAGFHHGDMESTENGNRNRRCTQMHADTTTGCLLCLFDRRASACIGGSCCVVVSVVSVPPW